MTMKNLYLYYQFFDNIILLLTIRIIVIEIEEEENKNNYKIFQYNI